MAIKAIRAVIRACPDSCFIQQEKRYNYCAYIHPPVERCIVALVGVDIGNNNCKLAVREGGGMHLVSERIPENLVHDGELPSPETMAKYLKNLRGQEHIREKNCALVLSSTQCFFRHVTLPAMTVSELELNLPYEFRDFISDNPDDYIYDYAVDELVRDEEGGIVRMELFAAAVSKELVQTYSIMLKKAGFKLKMVTPAPMAYTRLIRAHAEKFPADADKDIVLVDIGYSGIVVSLFRGLQYDSARTIDYGCQELDRIIADIKGIDPYTAGSYKFTNFEGVLDDPECLGLCDRIAMEISKVINFYNFNNPEREIEKLCFLGGGARIPQLTQSIAEAVSVPATSVEVLLPIEACGQENSPVCALAVAGMLEGEAM